MNAIRVRGLALVLLAVSGSVHAQVLPPPDAPDEVSPPIPIVPPPDPTELDRAPAQDAPLRDPSETYDDQYIGFDDFGSVVTDHGRVTGTVQWSVPYEGKYKRPLAGIDFYRKLGRADLVKEYQDRETLKDGLMIGGTVLLIGGLIAAVAIQGSRNQMEDCGSVTNPGFSACVDRNVNSTPMSPDPLAIAAALGGVLGGGAMVWAGAAVDPNPVGTVQARQLADAYNQELRQRLGVAPQGSGVDIRVVPHLEEGGASVSLAVTF
jgi:hypothetical protein